MQEIDESKDKKKG